MCNMAGEGWSLQEGAREGLFARLDPRLKLAFIMLALGLSIGAPRIAVPLGAALLALLALRLAGRWPGRHYLPALLMAALVFLTQLLWNGHTPFLELRLGGLAVPFYREGAAQGLLLASRVLAGAGLLLLLTATTCMQQLLFAARWLHVPAPLLEILTLSYRYVFVLLEETQRIRQAQAVRLGHRGWRRSMQALGTLGGMLILRAFARSESLYRAMRCRGYRDSLATAYEGRFCWSDALAGLAMGLLLLLGALLGWMGPGGLV